MIRVEVRKELLPFQRFDPETPGWVHWVYDEINRVLYCSQAAFAQLAALPEAQKDELLFAMGATPSVQILGSV